ncbi:hypothetical protein Stsp02_21620 [Streptomyces sp. NBRC 14336]|nr:hypothetical protein Stsp02_21620 [Streptomyces sp. NBRC 14336]
MSVPAWSGSRIRGPGPPSARPSAPSNVIPVTAPTEENVPGRHGPFATVEADPREVGRVRTEYSPAHDGDPDPGEIV